MDATKRKNIYKLEKFHNFFKKHWVWYTIIISIPTVWFSVILQYWGKVLELVDENGTMTPFGTVLTAAIVGIVLLLVFLNNLYLSKTESSELERLDGQVCYFSTIMENVDRICEEKYARLKNMIVESKNTEQQRAKIISDPSNQLKRIVTGMTECLVKLLNNPSNEFSFKDFSVTIAYRFPEDNVDWRWTEWTAERDLELDTLLNNDNKSTFNHLLQSKKPYYFNNKKEVARSEGKYLFNHQDELCEENNETIGSIFCYRYQVQKSGKTYVDAMISISTQKKRFSTDEDIACRNVRENIVSLVKDTFGKRIGIELSLLYLEYLKSQETG